MDPKHALPNLLERLGDLLESEPGLLFAHPRCEKNRAARAIARRLAALDRDRGKEAR
jgi:hypothetical protein